MESLGKQLHDAALTVSGASKTRIDYIAGEIADTVINEGKDPFHILATAARNAHFWKSVIDNLKPYAVERITKAVSVRNVHFTVTSSGKIDYSSDPTWSELERQIQALRAEQKEVEDVLKKQRFNSSEVDEATGEVFEIGHADRSAQKKTLTIKF